MYRFCLFRREPRYSGELFYLLDQRSRAQGLKGQRSKGQSSEVKGQRSKFRGQRSEVKGQGCSCRSRLLGH
ncbi:unnamed protein product [Callosobruchus maculatus]|uniref:Uncharacterized protein n=1 Tax=Callosobruchus maculatus TaxID=64391 RepID=A0A653DD01_CALMS|nr:unnamed protein product [Callosobruchus maculatus]